MQIPVQSIVISGMGTDFLRKAIENRSLQIVNLEFRYSYLEFKLIDLISHF